MSIITNKQDIAKLIKAGQILARILLKTKTTAKSGVNLLKIDKFIEDEIFKASCRPSFKGFEGYPATSCLSINQEVVHSIPRDYQLLSADILGIDVGLWYKNVCVDAAITLAMENANSTCLKLISKTRQALYAAIKIIKPGITTGDIGQIIQAVAEKNGFGIVKNLTGHGVGYKVHDRPTIPNYGKNGQGETIQSNMVFAIEPMFTIGFGETKVTPNGWNVETVDRSRAAQFEHTVLVTEYGCQILTKV